MKRRLIISNIPAKCTTGDIADIIQEIAKSIDDGNLSGLVGCTDIEWSLEDDK